MMLIDLFDDIKKNGGLETIKSEVDVKKVELTKYTTIVRGLGHDQFEGRLAYAMSKDEAVDAKYTLQRLIPADIQIEEKGEVLFMVRDDYFPYLENLQFSAIAYKLDGSWMSVIKKIHLKATNTLELSKIFDAYSDKEHKNRIIIDTDIIKPGIYSSYLLSWSYNEVEWKFERDGNAVQPYPIITNDRFIHMNTGDYIYIRKGRGNVMTPKKWLGSEHLIPEKPTGPDKDPEKPTDPSKDPEEEKGNIVLIGISLILIASLGIVYIKK